LLEYASHPTVEPENPLTFDSRPAEPTALARTGEDMSTRSTALTLMLGSLAVAVCVAADPNMGTWKLNEAKSKLNPNGPRNHTVIYAPAGDSVKVTVDGTDPSGKPTHNEWTGKFDGKEYAVTGDATSDMRSYTRVDDHTLELTGKKGGQVTLTGRVVVSADGKTRTVTVNGTDAKGNKFTSTAVYDKQ
jgi:hypothetical protein